MKIGFLVFNLNGMGGTSRSVITQANALAAHPAGHEVRLISVTRTSERPHYEIDERVAIEHLVDLRDPKHPALDATTAAAAAAAHARESSLVPVRWDAQFTALCDLALERRLPRLADGAGFDVLVTVTPGLLACGISLAPDTVVVVHQEHRSSNDRTTGLEPLLTFSPHADVVALLTPTIEHWLRDQLGGLTPHTVVMPNPLPLGFTPRSSLSSPLIMAAGRLVPEKQLVKLVEAFARVSHELPEWRLRICGDGPSRGELARQVRKRDLWDRVELPGSLPDMAAEWPKASVAALSSRAEGYPLVLQEAMAAGVPAVSFDCPSGPREIIDHEVNGLLVSPQSVIGLAAALLRVATDHDLRHRLGAGALRTSRDWEAGALAERWLQIFEDAVVRRGGRGRLAARADAPPPALAPDPSEDPAVLAAQHGVTPARARHDALATCVAAAAVAAPATTADPHPWLVIPAHEHPEPILVLPMARRTQFLDALAAAPGPAFLSLRDPALHGWHERRGTVTSLAADLRRGMTSTLYVEPWPQVGGRASLLGLACSVEVQFWESGPTDELVAPRPNPYAAQLTTSVRAGAVLTEVDGVEVPTLALMVPPTVTECRFPIDVVVTWVDGTDPEWDASRQARLSALADSAGGAGGARRREASGRARFLDHGELRYALRSLDLFAPWVRRIHLVTAGQKPDWLDVDHPRINLVDHRDILPPEALPTFNSHAIESALHRIEGLAEHFIYVNDDVMLARPLRPEDFFSGSGITAVALSPVTVGLGDDPSAPPFVKAAWNNRELLSQEFGAVLCRTTQHTPQPHRVSVLEEIEARFPEALAATARAPFRSNTDVSLTSSFAQHYGLLTGTAVASTADLAYVDISNADLERRLRGLRDRSQDYICIADHHDHALRAERLEEVLHEFFGDYFPVAAPWELSAP